MNLDRRCFIGSSGIAAVVATRPEALMAKNGEGSLIEIPDEGWRMWPDTKAEWETDAIFLPDEVDLANLPLRVPTGGWEALSSEQGIAVSLPASVEQFHWGKLQSRPYTYQEYEHAAYDNEVSNGAYRGVSWFWRTVQLSALPLGKSAHLRVRGFRQRIELFVNQKLVGYDIIAETAYECDITAALVAGANRIAIRVTNPGGVDDWRDFEKVKWGACEFHAGRGFGGLDRGLTVHIHDDVFIKDIWVLNTPEVRTVGTYVEVANLSATNREVQIDLSATANGKITSSGRRLMRIEAGKTEIFSIPVECPKGPLWSHETPNLHQMSVALTGERISDLRTVTFGLRWFAATGIGTKAAFRLNGKRIRIYSSIEFGYWGFNGLWPTPELAKKSVRGAKTLGLNGLSYHRNLGKAESFAEDDRQGLLRHMECGGGLFCYQNDKAGTNEATNAPPTQPPIDTSGTLRGERPWSERYMEARLLQMIRDHRSHPSLIVYHLQNESVPNLHNPKIFHTLRKMREADSSRAVVLHSGIEARNQAFYLPYDDKIRVEDGTGYSGWADQHTVGGTGVWNDRLYVNPRSFAHYEENVREIAVLGEMLGWGAPANHALKLASIRAGGGASYDTDIHENVLAAYEAFLSNWGFRTLYPNASAMLKEAGDKPFETGARVLRIARTCDATDHFILNGWEAQPIDSHSGFLDNQRNFKGDPALVREALRPVTPVVQPRGVVHRLGSNALLDLFWIDETGGMQPPTLTCRVTSPSGTVQTVGSYPVPQMTQDQFTVIIAEEVQTPAFFQSGYYDLALDTDGGIGGTTRIFVVDPAPAMARAPNVGIGGDIRAFMAFVPNSQIDADQYRSKTVYDAIIGIGFETDRIVPLSPAFSAVRNGTPLLILAQNNSDAHRWAKMLSGQGAFEHFGAAAENRGCWMGSWVFAKAHPAYDGLPSNQIMKWEYQVAHDDISALLIDGAGVEMIAGAGRDHDSRLGAATFTASLGKGRLLFQCIRRMQPLIYERFINNTLRYLIQGL
jgi:beta-galactosidase